MSETASRRQRTSVKHLSPRSQAFDALSEHRHLVLAAGVLLLLFAAWCGWRSLDSSSPRESDEEFAELDGFDAAEAPALGAAETAATLNMSPSMAEMTLPPWNGTIPPSPSGSPTDGSLVSFATSQETMAFASHESLPVWFVGAIEPVEDAIELPAWAPAITPQFDPRHANAVGSQPNLR
jgi:hypothetical protein